MLSYLRPEPEPSVGPTTSGKAEPDSSPADSDASSSLLGAAYFAAEAVDVVVARLDAGPAVVRAAAAFLSNAERSRASRFAMARDRRRFTVARSILRQLLAARLGARPDSVELNTEKRGKPALANRFATSGLRFNLSHAGDIAVYAFSSGREVGIDVEEVRALPDADQLAARFFSRREKEAYLALDAQDRPVGFFNCWTRKEALVKALGVGLLHPLDSFDVSLAPDEPARIIRLDSTFGGPSAWGMAAFSPAPGLVAAVVAERRGVRDNSSGSGAWCKAGHDTLTRKALGSRHA